MPIERRYRTTIQRVAAGIIDGFVFIPISWLDDHFSATSSKSGFFLWTLIHLLIWLLYSVYLNGKYGQTLGKMASNVKVYSLDEKSLIGYKRAFYRELPLITIMILGMIYLLLTTVNSEVLSEDTKSRFDNFIFYVSTISTLAELITMLVNPKRRAIHDFIAGSVVLDITKYKKWDFEYEETARESSSDHEVK